jgi:GTP1/Obg family GTP-binding protein
MTICSPVDRKKIKDALQEISASMTRIEAERDLIRDIKTGLHEEHKEVLSKKQIARMARVYHKQNFEEEVASHEEFEILYEQVTGLGESIKPVSSE